MSSTQPLPADNTDASGAWCVYLLECKNGAFYTGITNRLHERFKAHQCGKGAKYTRANPPLRILAHAPAENRSQASKLECEVKRLAKTKKLAWFASR